MREIVERLDHIEDESLQSADLLERQESQKLRMEIAILHSEMRRLASQVGGVRIIKPKKTMFAASCPKCGELVEYAHNVRKVPTKRVECSSCGARLYSQSAGEDSVLKERAPIPESIQCPNCGYETTENLDPLLGTMHEFQCARCHSKLRAVRTKSGLNIKILASDINNPVGSASQGISANKPIDIPESLLDNVAKLMGAQPWPKGKSSEVRATLGVSKFSIDCAIEKLISRGIFKPQYDGVLYAPIEDSAAKSVECP